MPDVQLALVGSMASDDPEGWDFFNATIAHADGDPDIHILNNFNNVGAIEVNAFQSHSDVLIQKSTREGFGLTVSEAIWKARPFIGGNVGGIPLQIEDGVTGFLVSSVEECAERSLEVLEGPGARQVPRQARQGARAHALPHAALPARLPEDLHRAQAVEVVSTDVERSDQSADRIEARAERRSRGHASTDVEQSDHGAERMEARA